MKRIGIWVLAMVIMLIAVFGLMCLLASAGEKEDLQKKMQEIQAQANVVGDQIKGAMILKDKAVQDLIDAQGKIENGQKMIQALQTQYQEAAKKLTDMEPKPAPAKPATTGK